ncbi:transcriptional regulator, AraC family [Dyadobacter koreensis]|uniref:Transcriptional regulator, AraC family n=1 Tax=Dyadobacter koreensis TaxID=408657 RepID=A0A1H6YPF4_9BACT|nr:helix-turn-helix domain-containing protein [Dyadobacter koreensis]SEJ38625.1 transcriptional regulator, AraC family [Dyadobacter koreensis]
MKLRHLDFRTGGEIVFIQNEPFFYQRGIGNEKVFTLCLNHGPSQKLIIDVIEYEFPSQTILALFANQSFSFENSADIIVWQYNRDFYCIIDHDKEVGCAGFLFFGSFGNLFIKLDYLHQQKLHTLKNIFIEEFKTSDTIQTDMLQRLLKRLIIIVTRLAKEQFGDQLPDNKFDLIRQYNMLVEKKFKEEHEVQFYASELNKSPKTLSNLFARLNHKSPLKIIHDRLIIEAKRLMFYTDKSSKEVAYELGFEDAAHFSHFFKKNTGQNIIAFKKWEGEPKPVSV